MKKIMVYYILPADDSGGQDKCDSGVVGNARPCQGRDRGFEPRLSLLERLPSVGSLFALQENGTAEPDGKRAVAMAETIGHGQMQGSLIV